MHIGMSCPHLVKSPTKVLIGTFEANQSILVLCHLNLGTIRPFGQGTLHNEGHELWERWRTEEEQERNQERKPQSFFYKEENKGKKFPFKTE